MKKVIVIFMLLCLSVGLFAEGTSELSGAGAALVNELTATVQEGKSVVSEYASLGVDGLVKAKRAYFDRIFPTIPILAFVGVAFVVFGICCCIFLWSDEDITIVLGIFAITVGIIIILIFGTWGIAAKFNNAIFEAAPEVYVIKSLIGK